MKTFFELVEETINYYRTHPRAILGNSCVYFKYEDRSMCAVGRCMLHPEKYTGTIGEILANLPIEFKKGYEHFTGTEWSILQFLHDYCHHWKPNDLGGFDLTELGIKYLENNGINYDSLRHRNMWPARSSSTDTVSDRRRSHTSA